MIINQKWAQRLLTLVQTICTMSFSAIAVAAPSLCAVNPKDYAAQVPKERVAAKYCTSLLMAKITMEEGKAINERLEAEQWTAANKDRWAELMSKGMKSLVERDLCIETAEKISASYRQRFNEEPKCHSTAAK